MLRRTRFAFSSSKQIQDYTLPVPELVKMGFTVQKLHPVVWGDEDSFGHVNNVRYLNFFETIRVHHTERAGIIVKRGAGIAPIFAKVDLRFRAPVEYPDTLALACKVKSIGKDRYTVTQAVWSINKQTIACIGDGTMVAYDYQAKKSCPLPQEWVVGLEALDGVKQEF